MIKKRDSMKNIVGVVKRFMGDKSAEAGGFSTPVKIIITIVIGGFFLFMVLKAMGIV